MSKIDTGGGLLSVGRTLFPRTPTNVVDGLAPICQTKLSQFTQSTVFRLSSYTICAALCAGC